MTGWFEGPKSPGINSLEHEIKDTEVDAFIAAFPIGRQNGWNILAIPDAFNQPWYSNSDSNTAAVTTRSIAEGTFTGEGAMSMTGGGSVTSSSSASASGSMSMSMSSASASASSASSAASQTTTNAQSASSGAANAATSAPSNGAAQLVVGTGSIWALVTIITALVM
jgi:chitin deacetylase